MTYPSLGIALSGGAARGLAHVGVLQVLEENKISADFVAGCSMGAVIGAIYATGGDMHMLEKLIYTLEEKDVFDIIVPRKGLMKGAKAENLIRTLTKNMTFEQAKTPLAIVATDLISARTITFRTGSIVDAVRASISIPGVFEPVDRDGMLLVDGGVTERVPIKALSAMGADISIAVDVGYRGYERKKPNNIFEILMQSFEITEWEANRELLGKADIVISPNVNNYSPISLAESRACITAGRVAAQEAMPEILAELKKYRHNITSG